ncbi:MAG: hypothetical protein KR126chlam5_01405 [Candidatus Anoxychlamydiales bacterium]|nr:hypothetical protein [Candidatus Anoxychlamydiales bacterium]
MFKKKNLFFVLTFIISSNFLFADDIPEKFYIKERWLSLTTTFDIKDDNQNLGIVYRKFFSLLPEYHLEDVYGQFQAKARMRFFALGAKFDIYEPLAKFMTKKLFITFFLKNSIFREDLAKKIKI